MAIHSFCHLEEPVPQNNDVKKAHLFARKSPHLGTVQLQLRGALSSSECSVIPVTGVTGILNNWGQISAPLEFVKVRVACQKYIPKLECKASNVLMMDLDGSLTNNNGYIASSEVVAFWWVGDKIWPLKRYAFLPVPKYRTQISNYNARFL